jgi:hypothetical protein
MAKFRTAYLLGEIVLLALSWLHFRNHCIELEQFILSPVVCYDLTLFCIYSYIGKGNAAVRRYIENWKLNAIICSAEFWLVWWQSCIGCVWKDFHILASLKCLTKQSFHEISPSVTNRRMNTSVYLIIWCFTLCLDQFVLKTKNMPTYLFSTFQECY